MTLAEYHLHKIGCIVTRLLCSWPCCYVASHALSDKDSSVMARVPCDRFRQMKLAQFAAVLCCADAQLRMPK